MRAIVLVVALAASTSCSESPTAPSLPPVTGTSGVGGTWTGSLSDTSNGVGTLRLSVTDLGTFGGITGFTGSYVTNFADPSKNATGQATATLSSDTVTLRLQPAAPPTCPAPPFASPGSFVSASLTRSGDSIRGTYVFSSCSGDALGTLELQKQ